MNYIPTLTIIDYFIFGSAIICFFALGGLAIDWLARRYYHHQHPNEPFI